MCEVFDPSYDPQEVIDAYTRNAAVEDQAEKERSLRVEIPRAFIKRYLQPSDVVLDAGGGTGVNAMMMARRCRHVTLLDMTPGILELAAENVRDAGLDGKVALIEGDITDLSLFRDEKFSFIVCVGDSISHVLDARFRAVQELVRVAREGAILVIGCDSKLGFMRMMLEEGLLEETLAIHRTSQCRSGSWPRTYLYTVDEMRELLEGQGCEVLEVASTPTFTDTVDAAPFLGDEAWAKLKALELEMCTRPELLGMGLHLLFVAKKLVDP